MKTTATLFIFLCATACGSGGGSGSATPSSSEPNLTEPPADPPAQGAGTYEIIEGQSPCGPLTVGDSFDVSVSGELGLYTGNPTTFTFESSTIARAAWTFGGINYSVDFQYSGNTVTLIYADPAILCQDVAIYTPSN